MSCKEVCRFFSGFFGRNARELSKKEPIYLLCILHLIRSVDYRGKLVSLDLDSEGGGTIGSAL